ncbi:DNA cytosine methyltransferase [Mesobacillus jeotgali]|uniref:Cytosine-specific methyltransferase n=1 Tax=Mesobacillus jeotgali TaxID=129985 RepID=A0ABY9VEK9_9BACI|nr:DNA cytosine methyltransferase [Mesobacillus jeotgali]WNF21306.1 DNA cytosine methyltransferase [Mesobacillus jeotgali]
MAILDLFSGCGGLSEGFLQAGLEVAVSVEIDAKACETQRLNHPDTQVLQADLTELSPEELTARTGYEQFDVIIGGPPCQGFSLIGTRLGTGRAIGEFGEDPRNKLYREFVKYVRHFQPRVFLMENVPGLFSMHQGAVREDIERDFSFDHPDGEFRGYNVRAEIVRAVEFGVPQSRERVIFIGVRNDINLEFDFPEGILAPENYFTLGDAISDLPPLGIRDGEHRVPFNYQENEYLRLLNHNAWNIRRENGYEDGYLYNHISRFHNDRDRELFSILEPFQKLRELDPDRIPIRLRNGFDDFYRKLDYGRPSPTIIAHLSKDGLAFIHPDGNQARSISVREAARLQSFPDNYVFVGPQSAMYRQIGNAVPPLLGYHLGLHVMGILERIQELEEQLALNL